MPILELEDSLETALDSFIHQAIQDNPDVEPGIWDAFFVNESGMILEANSLPSSTSTYRGIFFMGEASVIVSNKRSLNVFRETADSCSFCFKENVLVYDDRISSAHFLYMSCSQR